MGKILVTIEHPDVTAKKLKEMMLEFNAGDEIVCTFNVDPKKAIIRVREHSSIKPTDRMRFDTACEIIDDQLCNLDELAPSPEIAEAVEAIQVAYHKLELSVERYDEQDQKVSMEKENARN